MTAPELVPAAPKEQAAYESARLATSDNVEIISACKVKTRAHDWLWRGYLAAGKVHIMAGAPGTGKTTLSMGLVATLSCGGRWPDGSRASPGSVLIWSGEDSVEDTLVPRLIAAGADMRRVFFVGDRLTARGREPFDPAEDFDTLEHRAGEIAALRLVIVDPIVSAVAGDGHKGNDVRRGLQPLVRFAQQLNCAVLGISHFSKGTAGRDPVERVTGSIAFSALARVVLATAKVPEEDGGGRILVRAKSNISPDGGGFKYQLRLVDLTGEHAGIQATRPEWGAAIDGEARDILASVEREGDGEQRSATSEAVDWLRALLEGGPMRAADVQKEARQAGIADKALRTARERLGVTPKKRGFEHGGWWWQIPSVAPDPVEDAEGARRCQPENVGIFGGSGHLRTPQPAPDGDSEVF